MTGVQKGSWTIESVAVDSVPLTQSEEYRELIISERNMTIEPAGIRLSVAQATNRSAVLEMQSQIYFADFLTKDGELKMTLTRPTSKERVSLNARLNPHPQ